VIPKINQAIDQNRILNHDNADNILLKNQAQTSLIEEPKSKTNTEISEFKPTEITKQINSLKYKYLKSSQIFKNVLQ